MAAALDRAVLGFSRRRSVALLRILLGLVFVWFGLLKIIGYSPVEAFVTGAMPWLGADYLLPGLGIVEMVVGVGLLGGVWLGVVLVLLWVQLAAWAVGLVLQTGIMFQPGEPFVPTTQGDFVVRQLLLMIAGLVAATARR